MTGGRRIGVVPRREVPLWEVPYESDGRTLVRYVFGIVFSLTMLVPLGALAGSPENRGSPVGWIAAVVLIPAAVTLAWRLVLVGVWTGEQGVRVNTVVRTRRVPWAELDRVWLAPATGYDALALWISDRGGADIETPIWRTGTRVVHRNRTKLRQPELARLMEHLRAVARLSS